MSAPNAPRQRGTNVWTSSSVGSARQWTWHLSQSEIDELLSASEPFAEWEDDELARITTAQFPLPTLSHSLRDLRQRLTAKRGFELLRGFPSLDISERHAAAAFVGIGAHLGSLRSQNAHGHLLGHVRNVGADATDPNTRIYQTNQRQSFHTDSSDVVGLLCLETGAIGGESLLVNVAAIFNEMLDRSPNLAALLFEPIATDRRGEVPPGSDPYYMIPLLSWFDDALTVMYQRQYIA